MNKKPQTEYNAFHLFLGLLLGFFLGTSLVYWHSNRQNDRQFSETLEGVLGFFSDHGIHLAAGDSIFRIASTRDSLKPAKQPSIPASPGFSDSSQFPIAQDKLLYTTTISIINPSTTNSSTNRRLDSLLGNTSQPLQKQVFFIEFWETPLNSVGYKMGKNKIMLFGIPSFEMVSLTNFQGKTYLKYFNEYFLLEHTTTFKPLIPVQDPLFSQDVQFF